MVEFYGMSKDVPEEVAKEMAAVGIVPTLSKFHTGQRFQLAGQWFIIIGEATLEDFQNALHAVGGPVWKPMDGVKFVRIATD